jgi:hypothetical protein
MNLVYASWLSVCESIMPARAYGLITMPGTRRP